MKKWITLLISVMLLLPVTCLAEANTTVTALPFEATFQMDYDTVLALLGSETEEDNWEDGEGILMLLNVPLGIGELMADEVSFQIDRNNSGNTSRLSLIDAALPVGDDCIAAFREALSALTTAYGAPNGDPFDEAGVQGYVEFGGLNADWEKEDVRISLSMSRMYQDTLMLSFANRLCYDADDLK